MAWEIPMGMRPEPIPGAGDKPPPTASAPRDHFCFRTGDRQTMKTNVKWMLLGLVCLAAAGCFLAIGGLTLPGVLGAFILPVAAVLCIATGLSWRQDQ